MLDPDPVQIYRKSSDVDPHWSYAEPQNLMNEDLDPEQ